MKKIINKWILFYSFLFSIMLFFTKKTVVGGDIFSNINETYIKPFKIRDLFIFVVVFIIVYTLFYTISILLDHIKKEKKIRQSNKKVFILILILLFLLWGPYLMTYFPGGLFSDTYTSIEMALHQRGLNNHHPILYTLIWKLLLNIGNNHDISIFLFTLIQYIFMGLACSSVIYYMFRKGYNKVLIFISFIFFALFSLIPFYIISLWKDTFFSIWILIYSLFLLYLLNRPDYIEKMTNVKNILIFIIITFFVAFSRNNGIYIVTLTSIILILFLISKEKSKRVKLFSVMTMLAILLIFIIQGPIYNILNLNTDKKIESLSIPVQQVAYISSKNNIEKKDKEFINKIISINDLKNIYCPMIVDTIKWSENFNQDYFNTNSSKFIKMYFKMVFKYPGDAIKAYALQTIGFWNIKETSSVGYIQNEMWNKEPYKMKDQFKNIFGFSIKKKLNPKNIINYAIFIWIMIYTIFYLLYKKQYKLVIVMLPNLLVWLTIMIATPLAFSLRYVFSIVLSFPLYLICIFNDDVINKTIDRKDLH